MKESQKTKVLKLLRSQGYVTRNWALQNYISRLGAIVLTLKKEGMDIKAEHMENGDYKYTLLVKPKEVTVYTRENGKKIIVPKW